MARKLGFLVVAAFLVLASICESAIFNPVSESHRSGALELFSPAGGSFGSLEETYEALRTFKVLGIEKKPDVKPSACASVVDTLPSTSSSLKDLFHALRVNGILKCELNDETFGDQTSEGDVNLVDADKVFRSIKALSQSDGVVDQVYERKKKVQSGEQHYYP